MIGIPVDRAESGQYWRCEDGTLVIILFAGTPFVGTPRRRRVYWARYVAQSGWLDCDSEECSAYFLDGKIPYLASFMWEPISVQDVLWPYGCPPDSMRLIVRTTESGEALKVISMGEELATDKKWSLQ